MSETPVPHAPVDSSVSVSPEGCLDASEGMRVFEFPCNERVRILLRVECMARRIKYFAAQTDQFAHEACLHALFELYELLSSRGDIKNELLQELDRQRAQLGRFMGQPGVSVERLNAILDEAAAAHAALADVPVRLGPHIAEFDFLQSLKGRVGIPAGSCPFDLPSYFVWLHRPAPLRYKHLASWIATLAPLMAATDLCLKLLREGAEPQRYEATNGAFELNPEGRLARLIRVTLPATPEYVCEVGANKYVVAVRFRTLDTQLHLNPVEGPLPFELALCDF
jgi:cell division protein ZapD